MSGAVQPPVERFLRYLAITLPPIKQYTGAGGQRPSLADPFNQAMRLMHSSTVRQATHDELGASKGWTVSSSALRQMAATA